MSSFSFPLSSLPLLLPFSLTPPFLPFSDERLSYSCAFRLIRLSPVFSVARTLHTIRMSAPLNNDTISGPSRSGHKRKGTPNKRWTQDMDNVLIPCLVDMAKAGLKGYPKAKEYLNKPIPLFEELRVVCGDDHATGEFARTIFQPFGASEQAVETETEGHDDMESDPSPGTVHHEQPINSSSNRNNRPPRASRSSNEDAAMSDIAHSIGEIAASMKRMKKKSWKDKLTDALDTLQGYSVQDMNLLYMTLRNDRPLAEGFYMRSQSLRIFFVDDFLAQRRASRP
ncbi:hypothetical protein J5N97_002053 [Dioscorea zingiberensis]|uniref:Myb/SANT-like domain-containing protein n=1 Tax=Dioscorea zingiberensis TaxID=325984 RepID=A0A9D5BSX3_9LILI|nr:hypothetical protein J5N97_002053 [Dioscorea zingiberensis]